jgi:hypothetical protein
MNGLLDAVAPNPLVSAFPAVNTITLAGQTMPGRWILTDATKVFGWQIQKGFGLSGAFAFPIGDELVVPKFTVVIWTSSDFQVFREVRKVLLKKPVFSVGGTLTSKALGIGHPELKALGVESVVVKSLGPMVNDEEKGGWWTCTVEFLQWRKPVLALPKPAGSIPDNGPPQPTALDAQDKELQALRAERQALAHP